MPLFGPLPDECIASLEAGAHLVKFGDRQIMFADRAPSDTAYKIVSGAAKLDRLLEDGRRQVLGFALPGHYVGISMNPRRAYNSQALGPTTALRFDLAIFRKAVLSDQAMLRDIYDLAHRQLEAAYDLMTTLGRKSSDEKIAWFLLDFRNRWERVQGASDKILLPMTRTDIADHLGLTIETVSRTFTRLAHDKVIAVEQGAVRVIDSRRLAALAQRSSDCQMI